MVGPLARISRAQVDEIIAHARREMPKECCGVVAANDGVAMKVFPAKNAFADEMRYMIHPDDQIEIWNQIDERRWTVGAIYHSHPRSAPEPSETDINLAEFWPEPVYLIVSLEDPENPELKGFRIVGGKASPVELAVT